MLGGEYRGFILLSFELHDREVYSPQCSGHTEYVYTVEMNGSSV